MIPSSIMLQSPGSLSPSMYNYPDRITTTSKPQPALGPAWFVKSSSWDIHKESDQWLAFTSQITVNGSKELQSILGKWVEVPVKGANFFVFHPHITAPQIPWLSHPPKTDVARAFCHIALRSQVQLSPIGSDPNSHSKRNTVI